MSDTITQVALIRKVWETEPQRLIDALIPSMQRRMSLFYMAKTIRESDWRADWGVKDLRGLPIYRRFLYGPLRGAKSPDLAVKRLLNTLRVQVSALLGESAGRSVFAAIKRREKDWADPMLFESRA